MRHGGESGETVSDWRIDDLAQRAGVAVDTIRYYQSKALLEPPRRQGRVAWYDDGHLERLATAPIRGEFTLVIPGKPSATG